jgi:hypothetical protein
MWTVDGLNTNNKKECNAVIVLMSEDKTGGREVAPSVNPEERSNLEDYKSKDKASGSASIQQKQLILILLPLFLHQK